MIDTHCHLQFAAFDTVRDSVLAGLKGAGVSNVVNIGCDLESSKEALALAESDPRLFATLGVHPCSAHLLTDEVLSSFRELLDSNNTNIVGIGETGLDYFKYDGDRSIQHNAFRSQLALAKEYNLPVVIHQRDAGEDLVSILREYPGTSFVLHCFTGPEEIVDDLLSLGAHFSFTGIITFKSAEIVRRIAKRIPLDRIMLETDAPYLAPDPHRGEQNSPLFMKHTCQKLAELHDISFEEMDRITTETARRFWNI